MANVADPLLHAPQGPNNVSRYLLYPWCPRQSLGLEGHFAATMMHLGLKPATRHADSKYLIVFNPSIQRMFQPNRPICAPDCRLHMLGKGVSSLRPSECVLARVPNAMRCDAMLCDQCIRVGCTIVRLASTNYVRSSSPGRRCARHRAKRYDYLSCEASWVRDSYQLSKSNSFPLLLLLLPPTVDILQAV